MITALMVELSLEKVKDGKLEELKRLSPELKDEIERLGSHVGEFLVADQNQRILAVMKYANSALQIKIKELKQ